MAFCTTCGKEVEPGKKFCEYCGTPVEQPVATPAAPAAPVIPPAIPPAVPPATPPSGSGKTLLVAGIIVLVVLAAAVYFVGLPMMSGSSDKSPAPAKTTTAMVPADTVTAPPVYVPAETTLTQYVPAVSQTYDERYTETYNLVYSENRAFAGGQKIVFSQDVTNPPLYIKYNITPKIEIGEKIDEIGQTITTSYISPNSWFKVIVYDAGNGAVIDQQGFNKGYSTNTNQEFLVRSPGNYRVEMSGSDVVADVRILTGKS